jgi:exodeoxyribonuclease-3
VGPTNADIYPSKSWAKDALRRCTSGLSPGKTIYTFWDYKRQRWPRDAGLRIDHILLSSPLAERMIDAGVDKDVPGRDGASDHAPAWVVLDDSNHRPAVTFG